MNGVINDVLSLLEHQLKTVNIQVRRDLAYQPPVVYGMEHKLQQVFLNLFLNDAWYRGALGRLLDDGADYGRGALPEAHSATPFVSTMFLRVSRNKRIHLRRLSLPHYNRAARRPQVPAFTQEEFKQPAPHAPCRRRFPA